MHHAHGRFVGRSFAGGNETALATVGHDARIGLSEPVTKGVRGKEFFNERTLLKKMRRRKFSVPHLL
jgi:hypothetical protein